MLSEATCCHFTLICCTFVIKRVELVVTGNSAIEHLFIVIIIIIYNTEEVNRTCGINPDTNNVLYKKEYYYTPVGRCVRKNTNCREVCKYFDREYGTLARCQKHPLQGGLQILRP